MNCGIVPSGLDVNKLQGFAKSENNLHRLSQA